MSAVTAQSKTALRGDLPERKQPLQNPVEASGPRLFIMKSTGYAEVSQVEVVLPAPCQESLMQEVTVTEMAQPFAHAHVEPDARARTLFVEDRHWAWTGVKAAEGREDAGAF